MSLCAFIFGYLGFRHGFPPSDPFRAIWHTGATLAWINNCERTRPSDACCSLHTSMRAKEEELRSSFFHPSPGPTEEKEMRDRMRNVGRAKSFVLRLNSHGNNRLSVCTSFAFPLPFPPKRFAYNLSKMGFHSVPLWHGFSFFAVSYTKLATWAQEGRRGEGGSFMPYKREPSAP